MVASCLGCWWSMIRQGCWVPVLTGSRLRCIGRCGRSSDCYIVVLTVRSGAHIGCRGTAGSSGPQSRPAPGVPLHGDVNSYTTQMWGVLGQPFRGGEGLSPSARRSKLAMRRSPLILYPIGVYGSRCNARVKEFRI